MLPVGANYNAKIIVRAKKGRQRRNVPPKPLVYLNTNIIKTPQLFTLRRTYEQEKNNLN
jgi:hypothetical protein